MSTDASSSPDDLEALQLELAHTQSVLAETAVTCKEQQTRIEQLQAEIELLKRYLYGRRSERFVEDPGQGHLFQQPAGSPPSPELPEAAQEEAPAPQRARLERVAGSLAPGAGPGRCAGSRAAVPVLR
jgi:hypothetical protein